MYKQSGFLRLFLIFFLTLIPVSAFATGLTIEDIVLPEEGSSAETAKISIYFDVRQSDNTAITGITPDKCSIIIDDKHPTLEHAEMRDFIEGDKGIGVIFVFPIAKNYSEDSFGIRGVLTNTLQKFNRQIDMVNAISYDNNAKAVGWARASEDTVRRAVEEMQTTDVLEPNLFQSFRTSISLFDSLQNVSQKYLVFITDAEGAIVGDGDKALKLINGFTDELKTAKITPIVIGYSPDGEAGMTNINLVKRMAQNGGGKFFQANDKMQFQSVLERDVYNFIFKRYILDATINMGGDNYLDAGKYPLQLTVKTASGEEKASVKISWPSLSKSHFGLILTLSILGVILLAGGIFIAIRRNQDDEEFEEVDNGPQEQACATCGKIIPQELYGFNGEFCLSGGLPDCPYYQMPDKGKLQITKGKLADVTFFIKKDLTTIGSYAENDIFLNDKTVSRKHAAIKTDEGKRYEIRDFGSSNGLYINNEKTERKFLRDGDLIRFGTVETIFKLK